MSLLLLRKKDKPTIDLSLMGNLPSGLTFSRASNAWYVDGTGTLQQASSSVPRFDCGSPGSTTLQGLLIEEQRTNSIRNSTMQGAVAGTPGTLPANWNIPNNTANLTVNVAGTGTEYGMSYVDIQYVGTAAGTGCQLAYDTSTGITAAQNDIWTASLYTRIAGGSTNGISFGSAIQINENTSGGSYLTQGNGSMAGLSSVLQRFSFTYTLSNASTARIRIAFSPTITNGQAINITFRLYLPQAEKGPFATSPIPTTAGAVTRASDSLNTTNIPWFNAAQGTFEVEAIIEALNTTRASYSATFSDGTTGNFIAASLASSTGNYQGIIVVSSSSCTSTANVSHPTAGATFKKGLVYLSGTNKFAANGSLDGDGTFGSSALPSGVNRLDLGNRPDGARNMGGWLRRFRYWNYGVTNAQLQQVTQ